MRDFVGITAVFIALAVGWYVPAWLKDRKANRELFASIERERRVKEALNQQMRGQR